MTRDFFRTQMERIFSVFGQENYPKEKAQRIWEVSKHLDSEQFKKVVDHLIGNIPVKYPPQEKHFREEAYQQTQKSFGDGVRQAAQRLSKPRQEGLWTYLEKLNAKNVLDAMKKVKNGGQ